MPLEKDNRPLRSAPQFGALLQAARKTMGLSINDAARRAGFPIRFAEALEAGKDAGLPAPVYLDGIIRRYARSLGLDPQKVVDEFWQERKRVGELAGIPEPDAFPALPAKPRLVITPRTLAVTGTLLAVAAFVGYMWYQVSGLVVGPALAVEQPAADITVTDPRVMLSGRTEPDARLTVNSREVYVDEAGRFSMELDISPGLHGVEVKATNRFGRSTSVERRIFRE
ncbi:helix-turn-helix domain-containing protein [Candidatus Parcubacteria bacterium]|nr:helix-turn-helix domain-containing protein [Candidatus Parcubacteria bacterium]